MAERRPRGQGLERVLGTGSLFSTAYGNVGSSIYYALGLVTVYALGMTPLVFVISGLIFAATAATYAEATAMYPEAGGSSSFARHAFNEFWSFFAAWGQMLNYIITVSISAFFVPHYLGVFWSPLRHSPGDVIGGIVIVAVAVIYAFLPVVALSAMPVIHGHTALAGEFAGDPVLGVVKNLHLGGLQHPAEIYVGILAATILFIATNAGLIGVSRLTYSMGQHRQLPERLRQLHPRFRTPYVAITVFGLVACLTILPGKATFLGRVYAFGAMLSFTIAHLAVIGLRMREPDRERPYRGPGTVTVRRRTLPLFAVFGAFGTGAAWVVVTVLNVDTLIAGTVWMAIGIATYAGYRRHQHLTLTQTAKVVVPGPVVEREVEYESVLVAFEDGEYSPQAVATAAKLAARRRRGIHVLVTITVPASAPVNAAMPNEERRAQEIIDSARVLGGRRVTGHWLKVRPGEAGRRIVDEARAIRARAIVLPLPPRRAGFPVFSRTLETVLAERPARVIIESEPLHEPAPRAA